MKEKDASSRASVSANQRLWKRAASAIEEKIFDLLFGVEIDGASNVTASKLVRKTTINDNQIDVV